MARINSFVLRGTVVGALGGLLFGFDTAVIAGTEQQLIQVFGLNRPSTGIHRLDRAWSARSLAPSSPASWATRWAGAKRCAFLPPVTSSPRFGCAFAWSWPALLVFRFIGGLAIGGSSVLGPGYIAEIAPARWRGLLVGTFQINIVIGILVAYLSNYVVSLFRLGHERVALAARHCRCSGPAVLRHAVHHPAQRALAGAQASHSRRPRGHRTSRARTSPTPNLKEIVDSIHVEGMSHSEPLFQRKYLRPMFLAATVAGFSQLAGINAILYYSNYIFDKAGFSKSLGPAAVGGAGRDEPGVHAGRHEPHRQAGPQDAVAHWQRRHGHLPGRRWRWCSTASSTRTC